MGKNDDLFTQRKPLADICKVPETIISVYALEKHVWEDGNSPKARQNRKPELQSLEEFQFDPVRPFLTDIFRNMAAPWKKDRRDATVGQGYWIQAEFGSGKSHLLCVLSALALGDPKAWEIVREKEKAVGKGKRDSLFRFWEEGLQAKSSGGSKGIFVIVKTLVGSGGGTVGLSQQGRRLSEYIIDAAKEQLQAELGKNLSLYPTELLADRFFQEDLDRYRKDLKKFLRDPQFFDEDAFQDVDEFLHQIRQNKSPDYKRSCGNKLWRFYTEFLKVQPHIAAETEDILKHLVETILNEGYSGVLLVLDEVSLFMKDRSDEQRNDDEKTLVVLANRLAKIYNLPIWTVCSAQQAIESKMGHKNIFADDRLKLVKLLEKDTDYYQIVLSRVREITAPGEIGPYFIHYSKGFSWPKAIGEEEFKRFFPFHKPALEVLRDITHELTTARSAIHFMHQTLKHQIKVRGNELIRLWELFDEAVRYEEDPSGAHAGLVSIKTKKDMEYRSYEACRRQIDSMTRGHLKVYRDRAVKVVQTLFLCHVGHAFLQGLTPEELATAVLIELKPDSTIEENVQHYETLAENLRKELRQVIETIDDENRCRYRFEPIVTGIDPRQEFAKARDEAEANELMLRQAWDHLLSLDHWEIRTRQMTLDLTHGYEPLFQGYAPPIDRPSLGQEPSLDVIWLGRQVTGKVRMTDLSHLGSDSQLLPPIETDATDHDFAVYISTRPVSDLHVNKLLKGRKDPRLIIWSPAELNADERDRLLNFAAYRRLVEQFGGKDSEDSVTVINWVSTNLETEMGRIGKIVPDCYARGRMDAEDNSRMEFHVAGALAAILTPVVERVLTTGYVSHDLVFEPPFVFRKEEAVKVINGIVKTGEIPKNTKPNQNISAAQNFGFGLKIMKKKAERVLDIDDNPYVQDILQFVEDKLTDANQTMKFDTLYKNFMGRGGPKDYGLTRRMVQLFVLCLVRIGKLRILAGGKAGLTNPLIDQGSIGGIDFSAKILDGLAEVQKIARPQNWDVFRPFAEILLGRPIPLSADEAAVAAATRDVATLFRAEAEGVGRLQERAREVFSALGVQNPYGPDLEKIGKLLGSDLGQDPIAGILFGFRENLGYTAFDDNVARPEDVDDLATRWRAYRDLAVFLRYDREIVTAQAFAAHPVPKGKETEHLREQQRWLGKRLAEIKPFIDSEVKLKTELLGTDATGKSESGTLSATRQAFGDVYLPVHDLVVTRCDKAREDIGALGESDDFKVIAALDRIPAAGQAMADTLRQELGKVTASVPRCLEGSRVAVEEQLRRHPGHDCGITLANQAELLECATNSVEQARQRVQQVLGVKLDVLQNPKIRERLQQGANDPSIAAILKAEDRQALEEAIRGLLAEGVDLGKLVNRFLKKIVLRPVKLADFHPSLHTLERNQIPIIVEEFRLYLESEMKKAEGGDPQHGSGGEDVLPILKVE